MSRRAAGARHSGPSFAGLFTAGLTAAASLSSAGVYGRSIPRGSAPGVAASSRASYRPGGRIAGTPTVRGPSAAIYVGRAFGRLPFLADALGEVGCMNEDVLAHCRGPGPHVLGCRAVDLLPVKG